MVVLRAWKENDWTFLGGGCLFVCFLAINFYIGFSDTAVTSVFFLHKTEFPAEGTEGTGKTKNRTKD